MADVKQPAHTPGPWRVSLSNTARANILAGEDSIALVHRIQGSPSTMNRVGEGDANARLIAAAPEMYVALIDLFEHCAMVHKHWGDGDNTKQANEAIEAGRAVLAKIDRVAS